MRRKLKIFTVSLTTILISIGGTAYSGILKSLDDELTLLVEETEPYLVTVKGKRAWRNLIATGIVYDKEGHVMTSSLVYGADEFEITFKDGTSFFAEKIGVDHQTGLAVLKIESDALNPPKWGSIPAAAAVLALLVYFLSSQVFFHRSETGPMSLTAYLQEHEFFSAQQVLSPDFLSELTTVQTEGDTENSGSDEPMSELDMLVEVHYGVYPTNGS